ncbi:phosphoglycerate mutase [Campylobacter helveticus]|uniref:phosphoglycerate mutase n=1 Tax=Campylobacter helveticus TaxID=28898 RepID=UPI001045E930|nr:phosphoglycerate mutase [Campylobacter helveticus]MCR2066277.1 hypothetical protein [Campylobacter helveticus]QBL12143.1 phosphoglycerate mutase [Campylobacter helveticus]
MFRKVKYDNGLREIYLGKLRIAKYLNSKKHLEYQCELLQNSRGGGGQILSVSFKKSLCRY